MHLLSDEQARVALLRLVALSRAAIELHPGARTEVLVGATTLWTLVPCAGLASDDEGAEPVALAEAHELAGQVAALCDRGGWTERRLARAALDHLRFGLKGLRREA